MTHVTLAEAPRIIANLRETLDGTTRQLRETQAALRVAEQREQGLLVACQAAVAWHDAGDPDDLRTLKRVVDQLRAALARASTKPNP